MARLLVRLKLRLLANGLSTGSAARGFGMVMVWLVGLAWGLMAFAVLAYGGRDPDVWAEGVMIAFAVAWVAWLVLPMLTFSTDDTLDPRKFALLPLRPKDLAPGLLISACVGPGAFATMIAAVGVVPGAFRTSAHAWAPLIAAAAVVLFVPTCICWSRALTTLASNVLASRRGRELTVAVSSLVVLAFFAAMQTLPHLGRVDLAVDLDAVARVASATPGGTIGGAVGRAVQGELAAAGWLLLAGVGWLALAMAAWIWALSRVDRRQPSAARAARTRSSLYPWALRWLPRSRTSAVAVRFLRSLWGDPRVRTQAFQSLFMLGGPIIIMTLMGRGLAAAAPLLAVVVVVPVGILAINQLGLDGPALWQHEIAGERPVADLVGRNAALAIVGLPMTMLAGTGLAAWSGHWEQLPVLLPLSVAVLAILLGVANVGAVLLPVPVPEQTDNWFGTSQSGRGCLNGLLAVLVLIVQGLLALPLIAPMLLVGAPGARLIIATAGLVYGGLILWAGTWLAADRLRGRGPELLVAVDPEQG